jgi:SNF2 family DNA or RNA helicase
LDLPPKRYDTIKFEMPPAMREIYDKFATDFYVKLANGSEVATEHIIVQMLKLGQICSGYVSAIKQVEAGLDYDGESEPEVTRTIEYIPGGDTKIEGLLERADDVLREGKLIVWSRFKLDSEAIHRALTDKYKDRGWFGGKYDSTVNDGTREYNKNAFGDMAVDGPTAGDDNFRWLCGSPRAGGVGLTLLGTNRVRCTNVFYYSSDFNFGARDQSEDRVHRIGLKNPVLYTDFIYADSIEEYIAEKLQNKRDLATAVKNISEIREFLLKGSKVTA